MKPECSVDLLFCRLITKCNAMQEVPKLLFSVLPLGSHFKPVCEDTLLKARPLWAPCAAERIRYLARISNDSLTHGEYTWSSAKLLGFACIGESIGIVFCACRDNSRWKQVVTTKALLLFHMKRHSEVFRNGCCWANSLRTRCQQNSQQLVRLLHPSSHHRNRYWSRANCAQVIQVVKVALISSTFWGLYFGNA